MCSSDLSIIRVKNRIAFLLHFVLHSLRTERVTTDLWYNKWILPETTRSQLLSLASCNDEFGYGLTGSSRMCDIKRDQWKVFLLKPSLSDTNWMFSAYQTSDRNKGEALCSISTCRICSTHAPFVFGLWNCRLCIRFNVDRTLYASNPKARYLSLVCLQRWTQESRP